MSVRQYGVKPGSKGGKPSPPNSYSVTPPAQGTKSTGGAPNLEQGSAKGMPSGVRSYNPKDNHAAKKTLGPAAVPSKNAGNRSQLPDKVDTGFNVLP